MRVCMVIHHYPPRYQAGVELVARRAARWLKRERHEVEVVCVESIDTGRPGLECIPDIYEDTTVHRLAFDAKQLEDPFPAQPCEKHHVLLTGRGAFPNRTSHEALETMNYLKEIANENSHLL